MSWIHCSMVNKWTAVCLDFRKPRAGFATQEVYWGVPWQLTVGVDGIGEGKTVALKQPHDRHSLPHSSSRFRLAPIQVLGTDPRSSARVPQLGWDVQAQFLLIVTHWLWLFLEALWGVSHRDMPKKPMLRNCPLPALPVLSSPRHRGARIPSGTPFGIMAEKVGDCWPICLCPSK